MQSTGAARKPLPKQTQDTPNDLFGGPPPISSVFSHATAAFKASPLHVHAGPLSFLPKMAPAFSWPQAVPEFSLQANWRFCAYDARVVPTEAAAIETLPASGAFRTTARKGPAGSSSMEARRTKEGRAGTVPFLMLPGLQ